MAYYNVWEKIKKDNLEIDSYAEKYNEIINKVKNKSIIIYGYGAIGQGIETYCRNIGANIISICDKNKVGNKCKYGNINLFENEVGKYEDFCVIVCARYSFNEIKKDLLKFISEEEIIDGDDLYHNFVNYFVLQEDTSSNPFLNRKNTYKRILEDRSEELEEICRQLSDDKSLKTLEGLIKHIISGNLKYIDEIYESMQYFPEDIIKIKEDEIFVDGGSYDGDTIETFMKISNGDFSKIYCFEPGKDQFERLITYIDTIEKPNDIKAFPYGLSDHEAIVKFKTEGTASRILDENMNKGYDDSDCIRTVTIDDIVKGKVSFIKMDIEGAELSALKGAENTIRKYKPKLAICVYHKPEDIIEIPKYIMSLGMDYKYYFRQHANGYTETVFYAV